MSTALYNSQLIKSRKQFEAWYKSVTGYMICYSNEVYPTHYPCVVTYDEYEDCNSRTHHQFYVTYTPKSRNPAVRRAFIAGARADWNQL